MCKQISSDSFEIMITNKQIICITIYANKGVNLKCYLQTMLLQIIYNMYKADLGSNNLQ